jgi:hypothetical protein
MSDKIDWNRHTFNIHTYGTKFKDVAGLYIFCSINSSNQWVPLYIGQASSLSDRLSNHERWKEAQSLGATHIHAKVVTPQGSRDQIEAELIESYQANLNSQLK